MTTRRCSLLWAPALAAIALATSCSGDGCTNNRNSIPLAGFYDYATREPVSVSGLGVAGVGAPGDSLLLDPARTAHQVYLPFRGGQSSTQFKFTSGIMADVVTFDYESYPYFDGEECGAMWRYRITSVTHNGLLIDSIAITDPLITNIERERIMFFVTATPADGEEDEQ